MQEVSSLIDCQKDDKLTEACKAHSSQPSWQWCLLILFPAHLSKQNPLEFSLHNHDLHAGECFKMQGKKKKENAGKQYS